VIAELDEKKREALDKTWRKVDADFGSIFAMLLPGSSAKLEPPEGASFLAGAQPGPAAGPLQDWIGHPEPMPAMTDSACSGACACAPPLLTRPQRRARASADSPPAYAPGAESLHVSRSMRPLLHSRHAVARGRRNPALKSRP